GRLRIFAATCSNHDELAAVHFVSGGRSVTGEGQRRFPEQLTRGFIKGAEFFVEVRRADEQQPPRGGGRTTPIFRARVLQALRREFRIFAKGNLPNIFTGV